MLPMLLNLPRAQELMARAGVDGLVAQWPINVYYLSGYWGFLMSAERFDAAYFAVLPRAPDSPAALVLPALELRRLASEGGCWMPGLESYSSPLEEGGAGDAVPGDHGVPYAGWPVRPGAGLTDREQAWLGIVEAHRDRVAGDAIHALGKAVRAAGLGRARLVSDDPRVAGWLGGLGLDACQVRCDPSFFNEIRKVKTINEIDLMRRAAHLNERALLAAAEDLHDGAGWPEIESVYMAYLARHGGRGVYFVCGAGGLPAGRVRRGEPMLLDALGQFGHYHGDFGRCAIVGEPTREHLRRHRALCAGWDALRPLLRPGTRYSELERVALETIRGNGFAEFRYVTPHGLGLEHTDDPKPPGAQPSTKPDQVLEPGMVLNVDMPFTEIGWGSVHLEDTVLIRLDGHERLTSADLEIITVPG